MIHDEPGDSETGHLNLGAGRIVYRDQPRINMSIADGSFYQNAAFLGAINHARVNNSTLHLMGLIGPGMVHSNTEHLYALLWLCNQQIFRNVRLHLFTDGRDAPPKSSINYLEQIEEKLKNFSFGEIATVCGRYYAMDRDNRWERTEAAYNALVFGSGKKFKSAREAVESSYAEGKTDEFIPPSTIVDDKDNPRGLIKAKDAVIFFNFRSDRARQLTFAFTLENFESLNFQNEIFPSCETNDAPANPVSPKSFNRQGFIRDLFFVTMTRYSKSLPILTAFPPKDVKLPLSRVISERGLRQLHLSETEKYPHVTYFFNGGREDRLPGEDLIEVPSPKVATYDLKPEMSAFETTRSLTSKIVTLVYNFIVINFANPDMVGHTGNLEATIKACEVVDECLGKIVNQSLDLGYSVIITSDHGNAEEMINLKNGEIDTSHSSAPVPFIAINKDLRGNYKTLPRGILADVAPTILNLMSLPVPSQMTGRNLLS